MLLVARDLLLHDPPRVLAWRFLHDPRLADVPSWLSFLLPRPDPSLDRDPVALLLGAVAVGLAALYASAALAGVRARVRGTLIALAACALIAAPTASFVIMGAVTGRPYGQDGGVVQLPLALEKVLAGESPYGADYSDSILGKEARASDFWAPLGGNPILHHHAYLPGTHLLMLPFYLLDRGVAGAFDPRLVTLVACVLAALAAVRLVEGEERQLTAAAVALLNPLVYWHQIFGANDVLVVALLLLGVLLAERGKTAASAAALGLACATKQLAWPFAPFLLVRLAGLRGFGELVSAAGLRRLARPVLIAGAVFVAVVAPIALLDVRRFWRDIVVYNVGLPGADNYPLGGTPGFGFANLLIYFGAVTSLTDYFPFGVFYVLLLPLGLLLLRHQMGSGSASSALMAGSAALLASLYFSRVVHPNYLILPAILLPLGLLMGERRPPDVAVVPLLLVAFAVEVAEHELLRTTWEQALAVRLPQHLAGLAAALAPRAGAGLTLDPLGLLVSAVAAGMAVAYLVAGLLRPWQRLRLALVLVAAVTCVVVPTAVVVRVGAASGVARGQDPWLATLRPETTVREAWSASFRRDPAGVLEAAATPRTAGDQVLTAALDGLRVPDPRPLVLLGLGLAALALWRLVPRDQRPLALGAALLAPAVGVAFGSGDALLLAGVLGAWALAGAERPLAGGLVLGVTAALFPRALFAAPFALASGPERRSRGLAGLFAGGAGVLLLALVGQHGSLAEAVSVAPVAPGLGLFNWFLYRGTPPGTPASSLGVVLPVLVGLAAWGLGLRVRVSRPRSFALAGGFLLVGLLVVPGASALDLGTPFLLLLLSALVR